MSTRDTSSDDTSRRKCVPESRGSISQGPRARAPRGGEIGEVRNQRSENGYAALGRLDAMIMGLRLLGAVRIYDDR